MRTIITIPSNQIYFSSSGTISAANSCPASPRQGFHQNQANSYNNYSNNNTVSKTIYPLYTFIEISFFYANQCSRIYSKHRLQPVIITMKNRRIAMPSWLFRPYQLHRISSWPSRAFILLLSSIIHTIARRPTRAGKIPYVIISVWIGKRVEGWFFLVDIMLITNRLHL